MKNKYCLILTPKVGVEEQNALGVRIRQYLFFIFINPYATRPYKTMRQAAAEWAPGGALSDCAIDAAYK